MERCSAGSGSPCVNGIEATRRNVAVGGIARTGGESMEAKSMRDESRWTLTIVRLGSMPVRVHMFFWLFAVWTIYFAWLCERSPGNQGGLVGAAIACVAVLAVSVFLHELGHWFVARAEGAEIRSLIIGPFGGMAPIGAVPEPRRELLVHLAGPLANGLAVAMATIGLLVLDAYEPGILNPTIPLGIVEGDAPRVALKLVLWTNWLLLLLNLIPGFPFDGGRILRAALMGLAPRLTRRGASLIVARFARLVACLLIVAAVVAWRREDAIGGSWFALTILSIFVFFGAEHETYRPVEWEPRPPSPRAVPVEPNHRPARQDLAPLMPTLKESFASSRDREAGPDLESHAIDACRRAQRREDDELVDVFLTRVSEIGVDGLSPAERAVLDRASERYRRQRGERAAT